MTHYTLIGGTAKAITGGKTLINGTEKTIASGKTLIEGTAKDISFAGLKVEDVFKDSAIDNIIYSSIVGSGPTWHREISFPTAGTYFLFQINATSTTAYWWKISEVSSDGSTVSINRYWENSSSTTETTYTLSGNKITTANGTTLGVIFALKFNLNTAKLEAFFDVLSDAVSIIYGRNGTSTSSSISSFTGYSFVGTGDYTSASTSTTYTSYFGVASVTSSGTITSLWGFGFQSVRKSSTTTNTEKTFSNKSLLRYASKKFYTSLDGSNNYSSKSCHIWSASL